MAQAPIFAGAKMGHPALVFRDVRLLDVRMPVMLVSVMMPRSRTERARERRNCNQGQ